MQRATRTVRVARGRSCLDLLTARTAIAACFSPVGPARPCGVPLLPLGVAQRAIGAPTRVLVTTATPRAGLARLRIEVRAEGRAGGEMAGHAAAPRTRLISSQSGGRSEERRVG